MDFRPNVQKLILAGAPETEHIAILWYTVTDGGVGLHYHAKTESVYVIDGTQTDAKGFVTTYTYNDRGLETTRTQASGTPQARTTTTTWHATFNLPLTVTEGGQVTTYTYDTQGRQTSRTQTAL